MIQVEKNFDFFYFPPVEITENDEKFLFEIGVQLKFSEKEIVI